MAFLTKEDLKTVSDINLVDKITNLDDSIVDDIIIESIDLMKGFLSRYYDAEAIFAQEGENRKPRHILKKLKDIVIYEIYNRNKWGMNQQTADAYSETMNWLEKMNTGTFSDNTLPPIPDEPDAEAGKEGDTRFGGNTRYNSIY